MDTPTAQRIRQRWNQSSSGARKFDAAKQSNITKSFPGSWGTADFEQRFDQQIIVARSRQLAESDKYMQSVIGSLLNNILGATGINFQCKIVNQKFAGDSNDEPDKQANDIVESFHKKVGNRRNYSVTRNLTRRAAERVMFRSVIVDGEVFVRTYYDFRNETGIARQIISAEVCDLNYNVPNLPGGGQIRMGVELDEFGAPVAYHFLKRAPNDYQYPQGATELRERVEARFVQHIFLKLRPGQTRGIPWIVASMMQLRMLGLWEDAALLNAKIGASRNLFYTKDYPNGWENSDTDLPQDNGAIIDDLREGEALELPRGVKPMMLDTRYPDAAVGDFSKAMIRGIAAGVNMSYMTVSGDLSEANFSSLRAGLNEERSNYAAIQIWWVEDQSTPEFEDTLTWGLQTQKIKLPPGRFDKYNQPVFTGRRWPSVNPLQDAQADALLIAQRLKSRSECILERGGDPDEVFAGCAQDEESLEELGISVADGAAPAEEPEGPQDESDDGGKKKPSQQLGDDKK